MNFYADRQKRIEIFKDTEKSCKSNPTLLSAVTNSIKNQVVYLESASIPDEQKSCPMPCNVLVSKKRTFEAAADYAKVGKKVCVLNFASAMSPGGGVVNGSGAQEECLCRCSTLYPCLSAAYVEFHGYHKNLLDEGKINGLYNDDCIFTPDVVVFKTDTLLPETMAESDWYKVDVITCAAPNLGRERNCSDEKLFEIHKKRLEQILKIAAFHGAEVLILGAFGCGAFHNPPEIVAKAEKEILADFKDKFETVEFAVFCPPTRSENYDTFKEVFG